METMLEIVQPAGVLQLMLRPDLEPHAELVLITDLWEALVPQVRVRLLKRTAPDAVWLAVMEWPGAL